MATARGWVSPSVLPGFGMTLGFAGLFLTFIVLIPMAALIIRASSLPLDEFWRIATEPRALASYRLTFGASLVAASLNAVFGFIIAWTLVRYRFPGRRLVDAIIDLPFALPTAVSGIALATVFAPNGWIGTLLEPLGIQVAYTWLGVVVALTLIGLPFVVRSVQPALEEVDVSLEEAAESLGASRWMVFRRVILPTVLPSLATGFTLALGARRRRIRLRDLHRGQFADAHGDHAALDRHQARAIRLPRRGGARSRDALRVVRDVVDDQRDQRLAHSPRGGEALMQTPADTVAARAATESGRHACC